MNILVVCQYYYPEEFQINEICEEFVKQGHEVTVLTGLPNYPTGVIPKEYQHGHKRREDVKGVHVIRCYEIPRKKGIIGLGLNYFSFMFSGLFQIKKLRYNYDVIYIHQYSPVLMGFPGIFAKLLMKRKIFLYCCDLWPESVKVMKIKENSLIFKLVGHISTFIYSHCDVIGVQTPAFFEYFQDIHGIASNKLAYIPQFADSSYLNKNFNKPHKGVNLIFLGNIGLVQDMECIVEAVSINAKDHLSYKVHIVGDGSFLSDLKQLVKQKRLDEYFVFYGRRPVQEMETFYGLADACLLTLKGDSFVGKTVPGKLQGYMAAGKTVIAAIDGPAQQIIHDADCGLVTNAGNAENLAKHIKQFVTHIHDYQNCGTNGRIYFQKHFMKEQCVKHVLDVLDRLKEDA